MNINLTHILQVIYAIQWYFICAVVFLFCMSIDDTITKKRHFINTNIHINVFNNNDNSNNNTNDNNDEKFSELCDIIIIV